MQSTESIGTLFRSTENCHEGDVQPGRCIYRGTIDTARFVRATETENRVETHLRTGTSTAVGVSGFLRSRRRIGRVEIPFVLPAAGEAT